MLLIFLSDVKFKTSDNKEISQREWEWGGMSFFFFFHQAVVNAVQDLPHSTE